MSPTRVLLLAPLIAALLLAAPAVAQAPAAGLGALPRVALEVTVSPDHPGVPAEDLARRLEAALRAGGPAPAVSARVRAGSWPSGAPERPVCGVGN